MKMPAKYMLDTNMCIYFMKYMPVSVVKRFEQCFVGEIAISAITWGELQRGLGVHQSQKDFDRLAQAIDILPFDVKAGEMFGKMMQTGKFKASYDTLIASHALSLDLIIVTNNETDFKNFGLTVENWATYK